MYLSFRNAVSLKRMIIRKAHRIVSGMKIVPIVIIVVSALDIFIHLIFTIISLGRYIINSLHT